MNNLPKATELFDLDKTIAKDLFCENEYPWEALDKIGDFIDGCFINENTTYREIAPKVYVAKDAKIWDGAVIVGPCIIGSRSEVRPGAFIRGRVIIGDDAVIGNSTEIKNSIIFDRATLPHYNYVGDSIIGYKAHMGAGAIASNLRLDETEIAVRYHGMKIMTGRRKLGTMLGDYGQIGCSAVLCPGTIIGRNAIVYPLQCFVGTLGEGEKSERRTN